ncbi:MAG TPA: GNAT family N-acetyltransferase, partial [Planctomycetaceae bacterium]|nr:GNAT family N-acetyltransferase [Planctomycetaceae bacterium]
DEEAMEIFRSRLRFGVATFVAVAGERIIGTASLLLETKFIHNGGRVGHVEDVAVDPNYQGQGIGQALIHHLIEVCRRERCYKLILDCNPQLVPWYSKLGFREWCHAMRLDLEVPAHGPPESPPHQP